MMERADDAQSEALRAFLLLCALGENWQGRLVLRRGLDGEGRALSIAACIAGAACLAIDADGDACRLALRTGACDFLVNTVDEALRILKNEIRRSKPVSVALERPEADSLEELAERGVVPDLYVIGRGRCTDGVSGRLAELGTEVLGGTDDPTSDPGIVAALYKAETGFEIKEFWFGSLQALELFDRRMLRVLPAHDCRVRWAALAPRFFHRERPYRRVAWLTAEEAVSLGWSGNVGGRC